MHQFLRFSMFFQALQADPNLTDDMFVLEAPSFIVPYVYEKPPKEAIKDFKKSVTELVKDLKKKKDSKEEDQEDSDSKDEADKKDSENDKKDSESDSDEDEDDEEEEEEKVVMEPGEIKTDTKKTPGNYFETTLGKFVVDLGMNLVQEFVQEDLLKELTKKSQKDKSASMMHSIASLKNNLVSFCDLVLI